MTTENNRNSKQGMCVCVCLCMCGGSACLQTSSYNQSIKDSKGQETGDKKISLKLSTLTAFLLDDCANVEVAQNQEVEWTAAKKLSWTFGSLMVLKRQYFEYLDIIRKQLPSHDLEGKGKTETNQMIGAAFCTGQLADHVSDKSFHTEYIRNSFNLTRNEQCNFNNYLDRHSFKKIYKWPKANGKKLNTISHWEMS